MSVIIRLQNLPWSASALDIRQYFHGLAIPEGGVHIVGGDQGDAFIAFSTDEDARQAMLMDGGKIKEAVVRLHLSSRSQMQKVIEDARQGALQPFLQIPASVPHTLAPVQSTASLMGQMTQMNHMGGPIASQLTPQMALTTGQITNHMLQVLPGQLTQTSALAHSLMSTGQVAAPGSRGMPGASPSLGAASLGDAGGSGAAAPLRAARFPYGGMVLGGAMMGVAGAGAALPIAGATPGVRQPARDGPAIEEDADDRKDDEIGRRRDRRDRSRSRERRDRDRYRDRDRGSHDRRRRSRERSRERDRGRRRRSRSSSRSRDRNPRRSSRDKRDHDRSDGPEPELNALSGTGLLKTPDIMAEGAWNQQSSQVGPILRGQREDVPGSGLLGASVSAKAGIMSSLPGRLGGSGPGGPLGMIGSSTSVGMAENSLRGPMPSQGGLPMRNGPGGYGGIGPAGPGALDSVRRPDGSWMQRDLPSDVDRLQDSADGRRLFGGPGPIGLGGSRMGPMFNRPNSDGDLMGRPGMSLPGSNFMDRGGVGRPLGMPDRPGLMDRFRPNGFDRNAPLSRPVAALMDHPRPNPVGLLGPNMMKDRFSEMDNGDEDYEEQDMDMEDPFPDNEETCEDERNNQNFNDSSRNPPFSGGRPELGRDDRYSYRDDRFDKSRRNERDRGDRDRDRGRDSRDRRDRDRYGPRPNERDRERRDDSRYDRYGKDEFGRDRPDERYSRDRYKDRPPEPNSCIEIRNMALHTGYGDIRRFFQPLVIPGPGLKIINDEMGRRTGVAYIRFGSRRDRESALTYSKATLKGESILISDLSDEIFENAVDSYYPERDGGFEEKQPEKGIPKVEEEPKKEQSYSLTENSNQYTCVVVHNAPNYAKDDDIRRLFKYCSLDVFWEVAKEGRRQKLAYVKFKKTDDCKRFLFANSKFQIGNNEIKVVGCTEKEYDDTKTRVFGSPAKGESSENKFAGQNPTEPTSSVTATQPESKPKANTGTDVVPEVICVPDDDKAEEANNHEEDTQNSFEEKPQEEPYVPHSSPQRLLKPINTECICLRNLPPNAIDRDILDFFSDVGLVPLKIHIMVDYMRNPIGEAYCEFADGVEAARAATKHNSHMGKFIVNVIPVSRMEMNSALNISTDTVVGGPPAMMGGPGGPPMSQSRPPFHGPPGGHFSHGPGGHPGFMGLRGPGPMMRGTPNTGLLGLGPPMGPPNQRLQLQDMSAEGFGRPGCVIACENIPFRAEIDDILEYFCDFNLNHDSVIRRYNERGLPTGDARICFNTPIEAQSAIRDLRFKKLQGRSIYMRLM